MDEEDFKRIEVIVDKKLQNFFNHLNSIYYRLESIEKRIANLEFDLKPIDHRILTMSLDEFDFTIRTSNVLKKLNIHTLKDLCTMTEIDLLTAKNCGRKVLEEIKKFLESHFLRLGMGN
jgi:DNA-directed RNA polymerase subunit alpha